MRSFFIVTKILLLLSIYNESNRLSVHLNMKCLVSVPDKICNLCGKPFNRCLQTSGLIELWNDFKNRRYCSAGCRRSSNRVIPLRMNSTIKPKKVWEKPCVNCGQIFSKHTSTSMESTPRFLKRKHCSRECYVVSQKVKYQKEFH